MLLSLSGDGIRVDVENSAERGIFFITSDNLAYQPETEPTIRPRFQRASAEIIRLCPRDECLSENVRFSLYGEPAETALLALTEYVEKHQFHDSTGSILSCALQGRAIQMYLRAMDWRDEIADHFPMST